MTTIDPSKNQKLLFLVSLERKKKNLQWKRNIDKRNFFEKNNHAKLNGIETKMLEFKKKHTHTLTIATEYEKVSNQIGFNIINFSFDSRIFKLKSKKMNQGYSSDLLELITIIIMLAHCWPYMISMMEKYQKKLDENLSYQYICNKDFTVIYLFFVHCLFYHCSWHMFFVFFCSKRKNSIIFFRNFFRSIFFSSKQKLLSMNSVILENFFYNILVKLIVHSSFEFYFFFLRKKTCPILVTECDILFSKKKNQIDVTYFIMNHSK